MYLSIDWVRDFFSQASVLEIIGVCIAVLIGFAIFIPLARWAYWDSKDYLLYIKIGGFAFLSGIAAFFYELGEYNMQTNIAFLFHLGVLFVASFIHCIKEAGFFQAFPNIIVQFIGGSLIGTAIGWFIDLVVINILMAFGPIIAIVAIIWLCSRGGGTVSAGSSSNDDIPEYVRVGSTSYRLDKDINGETVIYDDDNNQKVVRKTDSGQYIDNDGNYYN